MADELGKKKPDLGAGSSSMPAPKQASTPKPAPNTASKPAPAQKAAGFSAPKQAAPKQPAMKPSKPTPAPAPQKSAWDHNNNPGSAVTTKALEDFTRGYLKKDGGVSDDFINKTVSGLSRNSKQADFYKQKMKEAYEREQASKMFGTDLTNPQKTPNTGWAKNYLDEIDKYGSTVVGNDDKYNNYEVTKDGDKFYANYYRDSFDGPNDDYRTPIVFKDENGNDVEGYDSFDDIVDALHKDGYINKDPRPSIDYDEIEKRKNETPEESYARMQEDWKKDREQLSQQEDSDGSSITDEDLAKWKEQSASEEEEYGRQMKEKYGDLPEGWENMDEEQIAKTVRDKEYNDLLEQAGYTSEVFKDLSQAIRETNGAGDQNALKGIIRQYQESGELSREEGAWLMNMFLERKYAEGYNPEEDEIQDLKSMIERKKASELFNQDLSKNKA